ncbi:MAG TPA: orotate phosphoribosyltransferase [Xanthomonadaceae bacterium]|jgi:orotate phosphoribosyltransferase|nr:orotate phosphoribosyltransferase [Xanthomonadaceae bacterium]
MHDYQRQFLESALAHDALRFGEFTLKSGRISPYFFNAGRFDSGAALAALGKAYAHTLLDAGLDFDVLFGPAYKGIPLATAVAIALSALGRDAPLAFNRKEPKDHGEGGSLMGAPLAGKRVLIVDDVVTAGTAVREAIDTIVNAGGVPCGVLIALDRQERSGDGNSSATEAVRAEFGLPVLAIAGLDDLLQLSAGRVELGTHQEALLAYRRRYGSGL